MDVATEVYLGIAFVVLSAIGVMVARKSRTKIKTPFGSVELDTSDEHAPGIVAEDLKSRKGGLRAEDKTGDGAVVRRVDVEKDIEISTSRGKDDPKA